MKKFLETCARPSSIPISIIIGSLLISGSVMLSTNYFGSTGQRTQLLADAQVAVQAAKPDIDSAKLNIVNEPYIGKVNAPLTIGYWYDYQCPFCKQAEDTIIINLIKEYVDTGKVKVIFKDLQFLGADSETLGKISRAVWEVVPAKFYLWHKAIFEHQGQENSGWATKSFILTVTTNVLGASTANKIFDLADKNAAVYQKRMNDDKTEAGSMGLSSTPSFVIGTTLITGAQPYNQIKSVIDIALSK